MKDDPRLLAENKMTPPDDEVPEVRPEKRKYDPAKADEPPPPDPAEEVTQPSFKDPEEGDEEE